ncbi:MAG: hydroxyacid dehydrogenase [Planctomycetota bacterium]|nr:hydroxyacid dehydrogenase [Planctomycetota bacterium]
MPNKPVVLVNMPVSTQHEVIDAWCRDRLERDFDMRWFQGGKRPTEDELAALAPDAWGIVTGWGACAISPGLAERMPGLKIVAHSAGTVKGVVSEALWARNITVTSAAAQIAVDVAQYAVALMVVGSKNLLGISPAVSAGKWGEPKDARAATDLRYATVGVISASHVGRNVLRLLKHYEVEVLLFDPFVTPEQARELGAEKAGLDDLMKRSDIVTIHAPSLPATRHMINARTLGLMKDDAGLINTSRGTMIDEAALVAELKKGRGLWAFLDVTDPEPPKPDSPLFNCPNLHLTPHIAGSKVRSRNRLGRQAYEELRRCCAGEPPQFAVTEKMLATIA